MFITYPNYRNTIYYRLSMVKDSDVEGFTTPTAFSLLIANTNLNGLQFDLS